jgi:hypothetical protein
MRVQLQAEPPPLRGFQFVAQAGTVSVLTLRRAEGGLRVCA